MIHLKSMHNVPPRLQRMLLQLQKYDMKIEYKPGSEMLLADTLLRCPARYSQEIKLDLHVDYIAFTSTWIETLRETTCEDPVLSNCVSACAARMAKGEEESAKHGKILLGFQRRVVNRQRFASLRTVFDHSSHFKRELSPAPTQRPPLSQQDNNQCKAAYVLAGDQS